MTDYNYIMRETMSYYLGNEYFITCKNPMSLSSEPVVADTLDRYLIHLIEGCINVTVEERLERYVPELIKNEWFHQWPLVRWAYASGLLNKEKVCNKDIERAVPILMQLSKEGYPNAMCDIASCYCYGISLERSYEKAICLWVAASIMGYREADEKLKLEYELNRSKELSEELRLFLVHRNLFVFVNDHNIPMIDYVMQLEGLDDKTEVALRKIYSEYKRLLKRVADKSMLRGLGNLCWSEEDNPYSIGIKIK